MHLSNLIFFSIWCSSVVQLRPIRKQKQLTVVTKRQNQPMGVQNSANDNLLRGYKAEFYDPFPMANIFHRTNNGNGTSSNFATTGALFTTI
jgi:hypothetical protein